jgi:myo-inositol-1(or 4)-monophosphatase
VNDGYLDFAKDLAEEAGKIMKRYFRADDIDTTWKEDTTPLTVADTKINDLVIQRVRERFPEHGVIGEEASYESAGDLVWVVDPVEGTIPFSLGIPLSTFSLALVSRTDGQPLVGVVLDPYLSRLYHSIKGQGAYLNGIKIHTSGQKTLEKGYVSVLGRFEGESLAVCIEELHKRKAKYFSFISQAYSSTLVASGELISAVFAYGAPWDTAASALIVAEAGGVVTDMEGNIRRHDEFGNGCIQSCNQEIHNQILEILRNAHNRD